MSNLKSLEGNSLSGTMILNSPVSFTLYNEYSINITSRDL